ncbi:hypothetical protein ACP70R_004951 [Stipagrostis hirtigluma subsp. patula]
MSSAAARRGRKRRRDDAHEGASSTRRRRLSPGHFPAVRSFGLRLALAASSPRLRRERRRDSAASTSSARPRRRPSRRRRLGPSRFPAVQSFALRVALAGAPRRSRRRSGKPRVDGALHLVSTPRRGRSHRVLVPRARHFPGLRPFALRFLLANGASAPRRRLRKPAVVEMGNYFSRLFRKSTSDDGSELYRDQIDRPGEVGGLTVEPEHEAEKIDVAGRGIGYSGVLALQELEGTPRSDEKLEETGFQVRLQDLKLAELPGVLAYRPKEDLSELFTPLTDKDEREVTTLLNDSGHSDKIIVIHEPSNIEITKEKLQCLRPRGWLNDEVINLYIELLKERAEREPKRFLKCHFFNTFFYKKLTCGVAGYDYQSVRRWTTFKKLGYGLIECEKIFVPIHRDIHWCLAVINMKDRTFQYLDSLGGMGHDVLTVLARYITDELKDKNNIEIDTSTWVEVPDYLPLQQNGWDCGMFMLKFIDFHSRGLKPSFRQEHMEYFRKRTAKDIIRLRAD